MNGEEGKGYLGEAQSNGEMLGPDTTEMCLVPGVVIPAKFKVLDFEEYKGNRDPRTYIRAYCWKMVAYSSDENMIKMGKI